MMLKRDVGVILFLLCSRQLLARIFPLYIFVVK